MLNFCPFRILSILDFGQFLILSKSRFCPFGILFILDFVQFGNLLFGILSNSKFCPFWILCNSGFCPFGILSNSGFCPFWILYNARFCPILDFVHFGILYRIRYIYLVEHLMYFKINRCVAKNGGTRGGILWGHPFWIQK